MKQAQLKAEQAMLQQLHNDTIAAHAALQAATTQIEQRRAVSPCWLKYLAYGMCAYSSRVNYILETESKGSAFDWVSDKV